MRKKPKWISIACIATLVVVASYGCDTTPSKKLLVGRVECPHSWDSVYVNTVVVDAVGNSVTLTPISNSQFSLPGAITNVPEFHDCQRLISATKPDEYVAVAAIFARFDLDKSFQSRKRANPRIQGRVRGRARQVTAKAAGATTVTHADSAVVTEGIAVAEIVSEGDYKELGIQIGFNCLFLDDNGGPWTGVMVSVGGKEVKCEGLALTSTMTISKVWVKPGAVGTSPTDVPPVARWDYDAKHNVQLIGIKCDDRWCDVGGRPDFQPPPPAGGPASPKQQRIKGWYDEQRVAEFDAGTHKVTKPGATTATVIPDPQLGNYTMQLFEAVGTTWLQVARVAMDKASTTYLQKYGFQQVASSRPMREMTYVYLCKGDADRCLIPPTLVDLRTKCAAAAAAAVPPQVPWWAKIEFGSATPKYVCTKWRGYTVAGFGIPPVVRWRWRANDETIWISCPQGCCETDSFDSK
jgi:hypothetical protein